jgi:DNA mismatch repair protein MutS
MAEQMETPEEARTRGHKQIERQVVRVITAGTITDDNLLSPKKSNFLVAVAPDSDVGSSFRMAGCDISTGEFFIGESESIFDDLTRIAPAEVIYPEHLAETSEIVKIREAFNTTPVYERLYRRADMPMMAEKIFGAGACGPETALLAAYLNNTQRGAGVAFRAPFRFGAGKQLLMDSATWKSLEIDSVMNEGGTCLLDILDKTRTAAGARKLRSYLRALSGDVGEIRRRQGHISHLLLNRDVFGELSAELSRLPDAGRAIARLVSGRGAPRDLRGISDFLAALPRMKIIGSKLDADFSARFSDVKSFDSLALELRTALSDNIPAFFRDGGIIVEGFDGALDNMRLMARGAKETIAALQSEYIKQTGINTLKIKYNNVLGYHIEVPAARADALMAPESGFIHRQTMTGNMRFTTARLIDLDNEVRGAAEKAGAIEAEIIAKLIEKIRAISDELMRTAELLADADVWLALADAADEYGWVRPDVTDGLEFNVENARHPVVEYVLRKTGNQFVKNSCDLNDERIALLTGPNMAGKSTYLRQNALLIALAHLGSFIPAQSAVIGVCDQLFSRVGASDNLAAGQSTFMVEMQETANILNRATSKSFIIFDEIGRGTATYDGMAIAQAVLEFLNGLRPRTLFATHYHELTGIKFQNVKNLTVEVAEHNDEIIFMHKIVPGVANRSYGIHVAQMAGMPESVIKSAGRILSRLESSGGCSAENETAAGDAKPEPEGLSQVFIIRQPKAKGDNQLSLFG